MMLQSVEETAVQQQCSLEKQQLRCSLCCFQANLD